MKLIYSSIALLAFFISTGFIFSNHSSIEFDIIIQSQTDLSLQDTSKLEEVDIPAQFEGGMDAFYKYVAENVKYPFMARLKEKQGRVFVQFIVDKEGKITDVKTVKSPDKHLSKEAVRVIQNSPKWIPATHEGKIVKVRMVIPISFTLD